MAILKVKGHEINTSNVKDSFNRRASKFTNNIITELKKLWITEYDIKVSSEVYALKKAKASVLWYAFDHRLYYSYNSANTYVENLYVVSKVIELEVNKLINKKITAEEFIQEFSEGKDVEHKRKKARETLGLSHDIKDLELINKKYRILAKENHPDVSKEEGAVEKFKLINEAHKILKRELE